MRGSTLPTGAAKKARNYTGGNIFSQALRKVMISFGIASRYLEGSAGAMIGATLFAVAAIFSYVRPYRTQKICMIIFSLLIMLAGMYKARSALGEQLGAQRYYYVGSVLVLWFVCCLRA